MFLAYCLRILKSFSLRRPFFLACHSLYPFLFRNRKTVLLQYFVASSPLSTMRSFTEKFGDVRLSLKNVHSIFLSDLSHKTLGHPGHRIRIHRRATRVGAFEVFEAAHVALRTLLAFSQPVNCIFWPMGMLNWLVAASKLHKHREIFFGPLPRAFNCLRYSAFYCYVS